jgi:hypothetical protein
LARYVSHSVFGSGRKWPQGEYLPPISTGIHADHTRIHGNHRGSTLSTPLEYVSRSSGSSPRGSDRGHVGIEILEEDRHRGVARPVGVLHDVDRSVVGKCPHRLSGVRKNVGSSSSRSYDGRAAWKSRTRRRANRRLNGHSGSTHAHRPLSQRPPQAVVVVYRASSTGAQVSRNSSRNARIRRLSVSVRARRRGSSLGARRLDPALIDVCSRSPTRSLERRAHRVVLTQGC